MFGKIALTKSAILAIQMAEKGLELINGGPIEWESIDLSLGKEVAFDERDTTRTVTLSVKYRFHYTDREGIKVCLYPFKIEAHLICSKGLHGNSSYPLKLVIFEGEESVEMVFTDGVRYYQNVTYPCTIVH